MNKLSEHAIRMLEIEGKGKNDGYIETRNMGDIARAVYDLILQVQMLKEINRKENCSEKPNNSLDKDTNVRSKEPQTESSTNEEKVQLTDCAWKGGEL